MVGGVVVFAWGVLLPMCCLLFALGPFVDWRIARSTQTSIQMSVGRVSHGDVLVIVSGRSVFKPSCFFLCCLISCCITTGSNSTPVHRTCRQS